MSERVGFLFAVVFLGWIAVSSFFIVYQLGRIATALAERAK